MAVGLGRLLSRVDEEDEAVDVELDQRIAEPAASGGPRVRQQRQQQQNQDEQAFAGRSSVVGSEIYLVVDDSLDGFKDGVPLNAWELEDIYYGFLMPWDEMAMVFAKYDETGFGEMSASCLKVALGEADFRSAVLNRSNSSALQRLERRAAAADGRPVTYQEFVDIVSNKRRRSFDVALQKELLLLAESADDCKKKKKKNQSPMSPPRGLAAGGANPLLAVNLAYCIADECLPGCEQEEAKRRFSLHYRCWPPPLLIPLLTLVQLVFFVYCSLRYDYAPQMNSGPVTFDAPLFALLVYRPDRRAELWRFLTYAVAHAGWWHLLFNMTVQIMLGLPLEMLHGTCRIGFVYFSGVLAGSLATSVFDKDVLLVGSSGGVYALLAAHVANVLLNYTHVDCGFIWIIVSVLIASFDVSFAIWDRYVRISLEDQPTSYAAHLAGSMAGLTIGFVILINFDRKLRRRCSWWTALSLYGGLMAAAILWNLFHSDS